MKISAFSLIINAPDPATGVVMGQHEKLESVITLGQLVEKLGYDSYQIGERKEHRSAAP